ncbi:hypothetical protein J6590_065118 [Homalodisca vitripennis]|nr:hypothetical protein J6590_065118 [Homalodisca vitripennis]
MSAIVGHNAEKGLLASRNNYHKRHDRHGSGIVIRLLLGAMTVIGVIWCKVWK